jgi:hypothetical protein
MRTSLPARWPGGAVTGQAVGYLLARQVPPAWLPYGGLMMIREAAGWTEPVHELEFDPVGAGTDPGLALSWVRQAAEHARRLGPPSDLRYLLGLLGDGVIRSRAAAVVCLREAGAGEAANPRVLLDLATWCGMDAPVQVITVGARTESPLVVYARARTDLVRARAIARNALQHWGILSLGTLIRLLGEHGVWVDVGDGDGDWRRILNVGGTGDWVWLSPERQTPLTRAACRIACLDRAVPLRQVPAAVARSTSPRRLVMRGRWPLPVAAVRAWAKSRPEWIIDQETIISTSPVRRPRGRDLAVITAFTGGKPVLSWSRLRAALQEQKMTAVAAEAIIFWSPLIRRTRSGYVLLG